MIKKTIVNNMKPAPGQDGDLTEADVDAATAYVWALDHRRESFQEFAIYGAARISLSFSHLATCRSKD